ncbi:Protein TIC 55, chloroplastic [Linum grandiflorum]
MDAMALSSSSSSSFHQFLSHRASKSPTFSPPTATSAIAASSKSHSFMQQLKSRRFDKCQAITTSPSSKSAIDDGDGGLLYGDPATEEEVSGERVAVAEYDWTEEWYPLYLTKDVPDDAPLGLTVFDKQVVVYKDGQGQFRCYEDRCPHRLAKLSEGQILDGKLECLYHGWQFEGDGKCVKIPQLPSGSKIPRSACVQAYEVKNSQGFLWVWMSVKTEPNVKKLPWFESVDKPGYEAVSTIHELPYDHSILLENLMDPAHIPISHDGTDTSTSRAEAQALLFEVTERSDRGFSGYWGKEDAGLTSLLRFQAPCVLSNVRESTDEQGQKHYFTGLFLCRPAGQGKSMVIVQFGSTKGLKAAKWIPTWFIHNLSCKIFEQDMGFLSSQNEVLMKEKVPTRKLYINLRSSDTWVLEYRKWMDKVGHGMPYHMGHNTICLPQVQAVVEHAPAGFLAGSSSSSPAKGAFAELHAPNLTSRYFRHVVHCKECLSAVKTFSAARKVLSGVALALAGLAILASQRRWKVFLLVSASLCFGGAQLCATVLTTKTTNFIRSHRRCLQAKIHP